MAWLQLVPARAPIMMMMMMMMEMTMMEMTMMVTVLANSYSR
jgi:hypothetical protein